MLNGQRDENTDPTNTFILYTTEDHALRRELGIDPIIALAVIAKIGNLRPTAKAALRGARTSTCRGLTTISSGAGFFLGMF